MLAGILVFLAACCWCAYAHDAVVNGWVERAEYAVRGEILLRAMEMEREISSASSGSLPANHPKRMVYCNIGNPQALGQMPLTFNRQVLSLVVNPPLLEAVRNASSDQYSSLFPPQSIARAAEYVTSGSVGAYSDSQGFASVRRDVARFITERDGGVVARAEDIFLSDGASAAVRLVMQVTLRSEPEYRDALMVPIPQYPLYSALAAVFNIHLVGYYLDEASGWSLHMSELERALKHAREVDRVNVRSIVVINPGNPTGQSLSRRDMEGVVRFCARHGLTLLADEVYQENQYGGARKKGERFLSFKRIVHELSTPEGVRAARVNDNDADDDDIALARSVQQDLMLFSFHSISKGFLGECGLRGGYMELHNIPTTVREQIYKLASITLCPNTVGQVGVGLMVRPPDAGTRERELWETERDGILQSLERRAGALTRGLNAIRGIVCQQPMGAMYAFPRIFLPPRAIEAAAAAGKKPDTYYCLRLLNATGVVVVPGNGFKQEEGTFHFRTTFLPPEDQMSEVIKLVADFHEGFMMEFGEGGKREEL